MDKETPDNRLRNENMQYKILDEVALARISINLTELMKLSKGTIKDLNKLPEFCQNIQDTIDVARDMNEEQGDMIYSALQDKMEDPLLEPDEIKEIKITKAIFEALR